MTHKGKQVPRLVSQRQKRERERERERERDRGGGGNYKSGI